MRLTVFSLVASAVLPLATAYAEKPIYHEGVYAVRNAPEALEPVEADKLQLQCYLAFGLTFKDGSGGNYFVDANVFKTTGKVTYRLSSSFQCAFTDGDMVEFCSSKTYHGGKEHDAPGTYSKYTRYTPDLQEARNFLTVKDLTDWVATGKTEGSFVFRLTRCTGLTVETVKPLLDNSPNTYSEDENTERMFYSGALTEEDYELARQIKAALGK